MGREEKNKAERCLVSVHISHVVLAADTVPVEHIDS